MQYLQYETKSIPLFYNQKNNNYIAIVECNYYIEHIIIFSIKENGP